MVLDLPINTSHFGPELKINTIYKIKIGCSFVGVCILGGCPVSYGGGSLDSGKSSASNSAKRLSAIFPRRRPECCAINRGGGLLGIRWNG